MHMCIKENGMSVRLVVKLQDSDNVAIAVKELPAGTIVEDGVVALSLIHI